MKFVAILAVMLTVPWSSTAQSQDRTFAGFDCTDDCTGHKAGYDWAEQHEIMDDSFCGGNSESFSEGCQAYTREPSRGSDEDDDGNPIEE